MRAGNRADDRDRVHALPAVPQDDQAFVQQKNGAPASGTRCHRRCRSREGRTAAAAAISSAPRSAASAHGPAKARVPSIRSQRRCAPASAQSCRSSPGRCATRSASTKPGGVSCQSEKVRIGSSAAVPTKRGSGALLSTCGLADRAKRAVDRGRTHCQKPRPDFGRKLKIPVTLHCLDQDRHQRFQPLPADPIRGLPQHDQRFTNRIVIKPSLRPRPRSACGPLRNRRIACLR